MSERRPYRVIMRSKTLKTLARMPGGARRQVLGRLERLGENPNRRDLDVLPLRGSPGFRLRVGGWRVIFSRNDEDREISVLQIRSRGGAY